MTTKFDADGEFQEANNRVDAALQPEPLNARVSDIHIVLTTMLDHDLHRR